MSPLPRGSSQRFMGEDTQLASGGPTAEFRAAASFLNRTTDVLTAATTQIQAWTTALHATIGPSPSSLLQTLSYTLGQLQTLTSTSLPAALRPPAALSSASPPGYFQPFSQHSSLYPPPVIPGSAAATAVPPDATIFSAAGAPSVCAPPEPSIPTAVPPRAPFIVQSARHCKRWVAYITARCSYAHSGPAHGKRAHAQTQAPNDAK